MQYRANCPMQIRLAVSGHTVRVLQNMDHLPEYHATETEHRLSVSMIQSIQVAVHADVRQSVNSIRRNVSTEEEPLQATKSSAVRRVVCRAKQHEMKSKSPVERGFVPSGDIGALKEYASHNSMTKLIKRHNDSSDSFHLNYHAMFLA